MARKSRKNIDPAPVIEIVKEATVYKAAGYIRLSVEDNHKKGDSVDTQRAILQNHISLTSDLKLHDFYIDNGVSGTTFERPAFKKMLADAEMGIINCIIVKDLSRLGRNAIDTGYYIEKYLPSLGCRFIAINDNFDSNNDTNSGAGVVLPLKNIINEAYALDIGRKIKAQQQQAMKSGEYVGARPPYGFLKSPDNCHKLIVDPITAPVVRQIFQWAFEETGLNDITRRLNEAGIATPSHYRRELGLITNDNLVGNGSWQTFTVSKILSDEVYIGNMVQGKSKSTSRKQTAVPESEWIRVTNTHEPIVSREVFEAVQIFRKKVAEYATSKPVKAYTPNIFKGKVFCGHCGGSLHRQKCERRKSDDVYIFHCLSNSRKARGSCVLYSMPERELLETLLTAILSHADAIIGKSLKLRENTAEIESKRTMVKSEIAALRQEAEKCGRMFKSLYESLVSGLIDADEYREMRAGYETKAQEHLTRASDLEKKQSALEQQVAEYCELSKLITMTKSAGITAKIIDCLIDSIRIYSDRHIEVDFRFNNGFDLISEAGRSPDSELLAHATEVAL